jgi:tRNA(Ile)-lysidine synthetase-like protein
LRPALRRDRLCKSVLYHTSVHSLAEGVLSYIRRDELFSAGDRIGIAVSGGIDSVALLRLLLDLRGELGIVPSVVHFNHKLRGAESDADQEFVAALAREFDLEFYWDGEDTARYAAEEHSSLEAVARELRYGFFHSLLEVGTSEAEMPVEGEVDRGPAPPPHLDPQGLKPPSLFASNGRTEVVPFPSLQTSRVVPLPNDHTAEAVSLVRLNAHTASLNKVCTGHTLDDQAETVLMRVIRGTGLRGLGAIHPRLLVEDEGGELSGEIIRPLLRFRRVELEEYLRELGQSWREDASNADSKFTRNRIRHTLMPLLEREFNPSVAENLAELAEIARGEEDYWENEAAGWMGRTIVWSEPDWVAEASRQPAKGLVQIQPLSEKVSSCASSMRDPIEEAPWLVVNGSVDRMWLLGEPVAVQRRVVKAVGEYVRVPLEFKHVEEVLHFAAEDGERGRELSLPLGWKVVRHAEQLVFVTPDLRGRDADSERESDDYEYDLPVPGLLVVAEAGIRLETLRVVLALSDARNPAECLLDAALLPGSLKVRNWRPGDRFWPAHTKSPKKIKELLQGRASEQRERKRWPVILSGKEIVWVRGFPVPTKFAAKAGREAVVITERGI